MFSISQRYARPHRVAQMSVWQSFLILAVALLSACGETPPSSASSSTSVGDVSPRFAEYWRDGLAEVAVYELHQPRYGEVREGEAVWVTVTEPFDPKHLVKRDRTQAPYQEVLKLNDMRTFETGVYDYRAMSSTFLPVTGHLPLKVSASVQEWCGHIYEELRWNNKGVHRSLHSYFESEQGVEQLWPQPSDGWTEDAFPLIMRRADGEAPLAPGESRNIQWLPSRVGARLRNDTGAWRPAVLRRAESPRNYDTPDGPASVEDWSVEVDGLTHRWFVEADWPHGVVGWERSDGERGQRVAVQRLDYWARQGKSDASLRENLGLKSRTAQRSDHDSDRIGE